ncbi:MAG TPA: DUF3489 domain-containing protein [Sphingomicrobium sp.]
MSKKQSATPTLSINDAETLAEPRSADNQSKQPSAGSKTAKVVTLLEQEAGATLYELMAVTGWLPHTTRAALTGIRKRGWSVERFKRDDATCYRIVGKA